MKIFAISAIALTLAAPAAAQNLIVIGERAPAERVELPRALTEAEVIELAAEKACEKPFIRNLVGWKLYAECMEEARVQATEQLAARRSSQPVEVALK